MCEEAGSLRRSRSDPILVSLVASKARCTGTARVSLWPVEDPMWRSPRSRPLPLRVREALPALLDRRVEVAGADRVGDLERHRVAEFVDRCLLALHVGHVATKRKMKRLAMAVGEGVEERNALRRALLL